MRVEHLESDVAGMTVRIEWPYGRAEVVLFDDATEPDDHAGAIGRAASGPLRSPLPASGNTSTTGTSGTWRGSSADGSNDRRGWRRRPRPSPDRDRTTALGPGCSPGCSAGPRVNALEVDADGTVERRSVGPQGGGPQGDDPGGPHPRVDLPADRGRGRLLGDVRAHKVVGEAMAGLNAELAEASETLRQVEAERLDDMHAALWPDAVGMPERPGGPARKPSVEAINGILRLMDRRMRLFGLDCQTGGDNGAAAGDRLSAEFWARIDEFHGKGDPDPACPE